LQEDLAIAATEATATVASAATTTVAATITVTTATAATATISTTVTTAAAATFFTGTSFVDIDSPSGQFGAIKFGNGRAGFVIFRHLDKSETTRFARHLVSDNVNFGHFAKLGEGIPKFILISIKGYVADVDFHSRKLLSCISQLRILPLRVAFVE
jgi:hypothetical protein